MVWVQIQDQIPKPKFFLGLMSEASNVFTYLSLELISSLFPLGFQVLTVATPRRKELNQPHVVRVQDQSFKVGLGQFDNVTATATTAARRGFATTAAR